MKKEILIKSNKRKRDFGEVYTPDWLVKDMLNIIPEPMRLDTTVLEPACGNGNFLVEILQRKLALCRSNDDLMIALKSIYGVDLLPDNVVEAKGRMYDVIKSSGVPFDAEEVAVVLNCNIQQGNTLTMKKADGNDLKFVNWRKCDEEDCNSEDNLKEGGGGL